MEEGKKQTKPRNVLTASFVTGAIALVFLILGYQVALFVNKAALTRIAANRDHPDTVYVMDRALAEEILRSAQEDKGEQEGAPSYAILKSGRDERSVVVRKEAVHSQVVEELREKAVPRRVETFRFNPNTVSLEDLQRLGFSEKQAQAIDHYRQKGGRFRRASDFAKSYVVSDSVFARLEPFIDIPRLDINKADSVALLDLPGIGPYFAGKVVQYRRQLGGYSSAEQLMDLYHFDREKYDGLKDLITCSAPVPYPLWELPEADLARHPYISKEEAHGIVLYRTHQPREAWTVEGLQKAGVLSEEHAARLGRCKLQ